MSFSLNITGTPKAVAETLRAEGVKQAGCVGTDERAKAAVAALYEAAALVAESVCKTDYCGRERGVSLKLYGHIGADGGNNVNMVLENYGVVVETPA